MHGKRVYIKPAVEVVELDASISLAMASEVGPPFVMEQPTTPPKNPFEANPFDNTTTKKK